MPESIARKPTIRNRATNLNGLLRSPYQSELQYFQKNLNVSGMATEDNRIILNPFINLTAQEKKSVFANEGTRLWLKQNNIVPDIALTKEQTQAFASTPYGKDENALRQTIIGRIISGDPSALNVTEEQQNYANSIKNKVMNFIK